MRSTDIQFAELKDEEGVVYAIGISKDMPLKSVNWLYSEEFDEEWNTVFDHAEYLLIPGTVEGVAEFEIGSVEEVKRLFKAVEKELEDDDEDDEFEEVENVQS